MLEARGLTKSYASVLAVSDVTFSLAPGQVLGCLGPNGSGKSTTVKMLTGLLEPTRGEVLFNGEDIHKDLTGFRKLLGYVPEEPNLYPYLSGQEYLEMVGLLRGIPQTSLNKKINGLLQLFSLRSHRYASMASYSKGMRQRILLIAALMDDPRLLIFDEPLSGLDVTTALVLKNLVRELGQHQSSFLLLPRAGGGGASVLAPADSAQRKCPRLRHNRGNSEPCGILFSGESFCAHGGGRRCASDCL